MNIPNSLSLTRICLIPLFVAAYFLPYDWGVYVAIAIFFICCFTDFLDGYIARKYNMVTDLGKLLDPIADKILICAALFCVVATNPLQYICNQNTVASMGFTDVPASDHYVFNLGLTILTVGAILILARELLISAVRQIAATKKIVVQANVFGKIKTVLQDVSLPMIMLSQAQSYHEHGLGYNATCEFFNVVRAIGFILFLLAVIMTIVSGVIYLVQNRGVFKTEQVD